MDTLRELNLASIVVRIALALVIGGVLGMERGRRNRPAGFRTYMLVCLGSALVMMTNQYVFTVFGASDPVRMGAQVVSGIGFLGAGTILMTGRSQVRGITTAAGLWAAACCGLAIGVGFYEGAIAGGIVIFVVMAILQRMDGYIRARSKTMELYMEMDNSIKLGQFIQYARDHNIDVYDIHMQKDENIDDSVLALVFTASNSRNLPHSQSIDTLRGAPGVYYIYELQ